MRVNIKNIWNHHLVMIFHQPRFFWNKIISPTINHHLGWKPSYFSRSKYEDIHPFASSVAAAGSWLRKASGFFLRHKKWWGGNWTAETPQKMVVCLLHVQNPPKKTGKVINSSTFSGGFFQGDYEHFEPKRRWFASFFFSWFFLRNSLG